MHKESNETRDSKLPDGSHQSPFSFGGVMLAGGKGPQWVGWEGRHQAFNLNKLIDFLVWSGLVLLSRTSSLTNKQQVHRRLSQELFGISTQFTCVPARNQTKLCRYTDNTFLNVTKY